MHINDFIEKNKSFNLKKYNELSRKGAVYFICEEDGLIIYIGTTMSPPSRFKAHSRKVEFYNKPFFFFLYPREKCEELEQELIVQIKPKYNIQWGPGLNRKYRKYDVISKTIRKRMANKIKKAIVADMTKENINPIELAKLMKMSRQRVHQIINGNRVLHPKTIKKLEKALGAKFEL